MEEFCIDLATLLSDSEANEELTQPAKQLERHYREAGAKFLDLNWPRIPHQYHPPYKVRLLDGTTANVTKELFESWAGAESLPE